MDKIGFEVNSLYHQGLLAHLREYRLHPCIKQVEDTEETLRSL